jgi:AraC-like DNA-binding protein
MTLTQPDEPHYTPEQVAEWWQLHPKTVQRMFRHEEGVFIFGNEHTTRHCKAHTTIRIPRSVLERVHRRMVNS